MRAVLALIAPFAFYLVLPANLALAKTLSGKPAPRDAMRQHYDEAFRLQAVGHVAEADEQHRLFLAAALHHVANGRANIGEYAKAVPVYEEALQFAPSDVTLHMEYAEAALDADEPEKARTLAEDALKLLPSAKDPRKTKLILILARACWGAGDRKQSIEQYKTAVAINPNFDDTYALGTIYLALADTENAAKVFAEIQRKFGDTATIHMQFGRAYAIATYYPEAISEFKKALARDDHLLGLHYSLGAVYVQSVGAKAYPEAEAEFRKELAIHPNDPLTYPQLGRIALDRQNLKEAEFDLTRADALEPDNPDTLKLLAQLYTQMGRRQDTELTLRRAIAAAIDPSRHHYDIERVHYQLGHMLIADGNVVEGKKEMDISADLLNQSRLQDEASLIGKPMVQSPLTKTHIATHAETVEEERVEAQLAPAIASSFDNLGVHAAVRSEYEVAANYFKRTAEWSPGLAGVDHNCGQAAYEAHQFTDAIAPLNRYLLEHPQDSAIRAMLGLSEYMAHDYADALQTLRPIENDLSFSPLLPSAYAESMVREGDAATGVERLKAIIQLDPEDGSAHRALAEAYRRNGELGSAAHEDEISNALARQNRLATSYDEKSGVNAARN